MAAEHAPIPDDPRPVERNPNTAGQQWFRWQLQPYLGNPLLEGHAPSSTIRWRMPVCLLLRVHSTGLTTRADENLPSSSSNSTRSSSRARLAPRQ